MRFRKIYLEITNACNLRCSFCPGTSRAPKSLDEKEFELLAAKLRPYSDFLYFHLMGEPLCHAKLESFLEIAEKLGFRVIITTNGTLLEKRRDVLLRARALHKINISLHAFEANDVDFSFDDYLCRAFEFGRAAEGEKIVVYRLWNNGGKDALNESILARMKSFFPAEWTEERRGTRIGERIYLEYGDKFDWPDLSAKDGGDEVFCYGLRDQIGVLCDGTVVPCCLDHNGDIALGNLFESDMESIISSPRAVAIYEGFNQKHATEELCRKCGYARRFGK